MAVQVKCTVFSSKNRSGYICSVCSSHKQYRQGAFDFVAAYLVCEDAWHIIPEKRLGVSGRFLCVRSAIIPDMRNIFEAWDLLRLYGLLLVFCISAEQLQRVGQQINHGFE